MEIRAIDAHVGGQPLRLIIAGAPPSGGRTPAAARDWLRRRADHLRRGVVLEPRGHHDMTAALFTEAASPGAHAGLVFMDAGGYPAMSGHGVMAAAAIAIERGIVTPGGAVEDGDAQLTLETPAGTVHVRARVERRGGDLRADTVAFSGVPSFVQSPARPVRAGARTLRVDVAFGGAFFAIVDTEAVGIPLDASTLPDLRRLGVDILAALAGASDIVHPAAPDVAGVDGVIFTGPPQDPEAHLRNVTVTRGGVLDRSAGAAGTSAAMAVLDAMGLLPEDQPFVHEGVSGLLLRGRAVGRTRVGDLPALVTEVEGSVWITGDHVFRFDEDDPCRDGLDV
jgi:proline racemase